MIEAELPSISVVWSALKTKRLKKRYPKGKWVQMWGYENMKTHDLWKFCSLKLLQRPPESSREL